MDCIYINKMHVNIATMKKITFAFLLVLINLKANAWGEWGHEHINKASIFALPVSMRIFFYNHADYLVTESVGPDLRKYTLNDKAEFARHYINLEDYNYTSITDMPGTQKDAAARYGDSVLNKSGILPWYIELMMNKLTVAMREGRTAEMLLLSADLGHYIADAHMPLHTSVNHDGQLTDQRGIHAFWESQLPELFGAQYNLHISNACYIKDIHQEVWNIIEHSHSLAATLLSSDQELKHSFKGKMYVTDASGKLVKNKFGQPMHTKAYALQYHKLLHGMVEKQMRLAIYELSCFWYTAWVNAGQPDLTKLDAVITTQRNKTLLQADYNIWLKGKLVGIKPFSEFKH